MKNFINKYKYVVFVVVCLLIGFSSVIINNNSSLVFNGDDYHQIYQFYLGGYNKIHSSNFNFFDFTIGFGCNIFAMAYYLFNPVFFLTLFLKKEYIQYSFLYFNILKISLLFIFTYKWAHEVFNSKSSILIGSFVMAFSGWVLSYLHLYIFLDAFILYPLVLYFIEKYIKTGKFVLMVLTLSFIGVINYYFLYMFLPFACIYALIRTIEVENNSIKQLFFKGIKFLILCILSVLISSFILIPCAFMLKSNPRFNTLDKSLFAHLGKKDIYKIISGLFAPSINHESTSLFIDIDKYNFIGWGGGASIYSFVISAMLLPLIFKLKNKKRKNILLCLFVGFSIMIFFKQFYYLLQLNMESRWFYMITFIIVFAIMSVNEEIEEGLIDRKFIYIGFIFYNFCAWLFFLISYFFKFAANIKLLFFVLCVLSFLSLFVLVYYVKKIKLLLIFILCFESIFSVSMLVLNDKPVDSSITSLTYSSDNVINKIKQDKSFYRVMYNDEYYNKYRYTTSNTPFAYDYNGVSFYSTIYNSEMEDFLKRLKNNWQMDQRYSTWDLYNLLSVKYLYGKSELKQIPFGYKLKEKSDDYVIYENENYIELGFSYNKTMSKKTFDTLTYLNQDLAFSDYLVIEDGDDVNYESSLIDYGSMGMEDDRYFSFAKALNNCNVYIETGNIENVKVSMFYKNKLVYSDFFWQYNYLDFYIDENTNVDLMVVSGNNENENYDVKIKVKDLSGYKNYHNQRFKEKFTNVKYFNDNIEADIEVDNNKWIFTSIGYDKGWKVFVDGKKVDIKKVNLGFIGFKIDKGSHHVVFKYNPPYFNLGLTVSIISFILLIFLSKHDKIKL